ncbi:MAG: transposase [Frankiales bacterium]|nr:transposase [Frankiales bacterium]
MADRSSINVAEFLGKQLETASPDLLREMIKMFAEALMGADADNVCNAAYRERSDEPTNSRNGYRERPWDTRAGSIELRVPKLGHDSCFPDWLLGRRTRTEQALISVVATAYLLGVSTRRVQTLVQTLGIEKLSRSQVSEMAKHLDVQVQSFRNRPPDAGPYTYLWIDALVVKVRQDGRTQNVSVMLATAVNHDGQRDPGPRHRNRRNRRRPVGVPARPGRSRPVRGAAGNQRRAPRPDERAGRGASQAVPEAIGAANHRPVT